MSCLPRQALRNIRAFHTTTRLLADAPAPPAPSGKSLGFGDYSGRTRILPTISIPATGRLNTKDLQPKGVPSSDRPQGQRQTQGQGSRTRSPTNDRRQNNPNRLAQAGPRTPRDSQDRGQGQQGARKFPEQRVKRQSRSPLAAASSSGQEGLSNTDTAEGDDFFGSEINLDLGNGSRKSKPKPKSDIASINIAFDSEPLPSTAGFKPRGGRNATTSSSSSRKPAARRESRPSVQVPVKREADDRSAEGIFGRASLLFPVRRGARDAERSIWAEGMKPELAREAELERLIGKPTAYLPAQPFPTDLAREGKKAAGASKTLAQWIMATNPGISMRRAKSGEAVLGTYLK